MPSPKGMPIALKVICGPAGSGKTERAMEAYLEAADRGDNPVFIAPSGPDARHFQRELLRRRPVLTGRRVTTLGGLASELFRKVDPETRVIGDIERKLLLRSVIADTSTLTYLKPSSVFSGFIEALARLIGELEAACIQPEELAKGAKAILHEGLNNDLFRVYGDYRAALSDQGVTDEELSQCRVAERLLDDPSLLGYDTVIIDGFSDLTPGQHSLVDALEGAVRKLLIYIPYERHNQATASVEGGFAELMRNAACQQLEPPDKDSRSRALVHLDRYLFGDGGERIAGNGSVMLLKGAGTRGEAALVAAEILRLYRQGEPLDEMAVVCRSLGPVADAFERAFEEAGVPFELNAPLELGRTPLGSTLQALLDFVRIRGVRSTAAGPGLEDGGARSQLLAYLRSSLPVADVQQVDIFARYAGLHCLADPEALLEAWELLDNHRLAEIDDLGSAAERGVAELGDRVMELAARLVSAGTAASDRLGVGDPGSREKDLLALDMIRQVCDEAKRIGGDARGGAGTIDLLRSGLAAASVFPPSGRLRECVRILDPHRVLNQKFNVVFVTGMLEGQFPVLGNEDPFISDGDRARLREAGLALEQRTDRLMEERFLFYRTLSRARNRVYLSYPYCSSEGKEQVRSLFVDEVLELVQIGDDDQRNLRISDVVSRTGEAPTSSQAIRSLCLAAGELRAGDGSLRGDAWRRLESSAAEAGLVDRLREDVAAARPRPVVIGAAEVSRELEGKSDFHATELESYGRCPFQYLVERYMQPAPMELDEFAREQGTVAHAVLRRFIGETKAHVDISEADDVQVDALRGKIYQLIDEEIADRGLSGCVDGRLMAFTLKRHLGYFLERERQVRATLKPDSLELPFGDVNLGGGLTLSGCIDRIDRDPGSERALVIDYKTGKTVGTWKHYGRDMQLQAPLYAYALQNSGMRPIGGEYYALLSGERRGFYLEDYARELGRKVKASDLVSEEQFAGIVEEALERARTLAQGIRSLQFAAHPIDRVCEYCSFASICRSRGTAGEVNDG